jgi:hypothetical protein
VIFGEQLNFSGPLFPNSIKQVGKKVSCLIYNEICSAVEMVKI